MDPAIEDADQILGLFSAILPIAQVESGSRVASFTQVDLAAMLEDLCALYRPAAEDSRRFLEFRAGPEAKVQGDAELLFQMLSNLVENAIRHTPEGSKILVLLRRRDERVAIEVSDTGEGMPESELPKVIRRFYRLEGSRSSPGYGLGLALVNAIAGLHGATLRLASGSPGLIATVEFAEASSSGALE